MAERLLHREHVAGRLIERRRERVAEVVHPRPHPDPRELVGGTLRHRLGARLRKQPAGAAIPHQRHERRMRRHLPLAPALALRDDKLESPAGQLDEVAPCDARDLAAAQAAVEREQGIRPDRFARVAQDQLHVAVGRGPGNVARLRRAPRGRKRVGVDQLALEQPAHELRRDRKIGVVRPAGQPAPLAERDQVGRCGRVDFAQDRLQRPHLGHERIAANPAICEKIRIRGEVSSDGRRNVSDVNLRTIAGGTIIRRCHMGLLPRNDFPALWGENNLEPGTLVLGRGAGPVVDTETLALILLLVLLLVVTKA